MAPAPGKSYQPSPAREKENCRAAQDAKHEKAPNEVIGRGAFGEVVLVRDPVTGQMLARKKINIFRTMPSAKIVLREIAIQSACHHDNIVRILSIGIPSSSSAHNFKQVFLDMELMRYDLFNLIREEKMDKYEAKKLMYQLLRAVKYLHSGNIIHRDIKPENILVNKNRLLKLCDFGHSIVCDSVVQGFGPHMSTSIGTRYYKAPEILMGITQYTRAVDMWAVGCTFAEILTRKALFKYQKGTMELDIVVYTIGLPNEHDIIGAKQHIIDVMDVMKDQRWNQPNTKEILLEFAPKIDEEALDLLYNLVRYPTWRSTIEEALRHPYFDYGRRHYHGHLCTCCKKSSTVMHPDSEPKHESPFDPNW